MTNPYGQFVPDPLSASGYRWRRHNEPEPTSMLPAVKPSPRPRIEIREDESMRLYPSGQEDLSYLDESAGELVSTEKVGPLDEVLVQPSQDPSWRPA